MSEKKVGVRKIRSGAVALPSSTPTPGNEAIAARAYQLFLQRGGEHGRELDDWLTAERELVGAAAATNVSARRVTDRRRAPRSPEA